MAKLAFHSWASGLRFMRRGEHWAVLVPIGKLAPFYVVKVGEDGDAGSMRGEFRASRSRDYKSAAAGDSQELRSEDGAVSEVLVPGP